MISVLKIVMRGCSDKLFKKEIPAMTNFYSKELQENCDLQQASSDRLGDSATGTCICRTNFCNRSGRIETTFITICTISFLMLFLHFIVL